MATSARVTSRDLENWKPAEYKPSEGVTRQQALIGVSAVSMVATAALTFTIAALKGLVAGASIAAAAMSGAGIAVAIIALIAGAVLLIRARTAVNAEAEAGKVFKDRAVALQKVHKEQEDDLAVAQAARRKEQNKWFFQRGIFG
jgi:glucose/arabinose dehydrogenase